MISCVVIGAGPGGIVATKELLEKGFEDAICVEQSSEMGGVFSKSVITSYSIHYTKLYDDGFCLHPPKNRNTY